MPALNWFDLVALVIVALAVYRGVRDGFVIQFFTNAGLFVGLITGILLFRFLFSGRRHTIFAIIDINLVLVLSVFLAVHGYRFGRRMKQIWKTRHAKRLQQLDVAASVGFSAFSALVLVWVVAAMLGRLPFEGLSNSANDAFIIEELDSHLPPAPAVVAYFDHLANPNTAPVVFVKASPHSSQAMVRSPEPLAFNVDAAASSVVRITGFGCGGIVSGSGFAVAKNLVVTDAHVLAGVRRPIVKYHRQSYAAVPVVFDPNLDVAVLLVPRLPVAPLRLNDVALPLHAPVALAGYPGGNYEVLPGSVLAMYPALGRNIYGLGNVQRYVYELQADIIDGSSGSPVISTDGTVAAMVFARSPDIPHTAYALMTGDWQRKVLQAEGTPQRVSTGACLSTG